MKHSDLIRLRKSGQWGRSPASKQLSMQSDITESIEVSERSFNDKLAKLQIHCFQNVKFMDQLKHNKERLTGSSKRKLEQIIEQ